ncbi:MAG: PKD domain-containing protein, partial [Candidatus Sumerlaeota bacterium]|nr:PKD domain-containing protein [Candidatus Sumerlaeota bacterium]
WDFGDGDTTTTQHPTHIYNQLGKFTVKLTVSSDAGNSIKEMPDYIVVYENRSPFMPTNIYPFNNQDGAPITTILVGSTFCDPDFGDVISKSQFQIAQNDKTFDQLKWDSGLIDSVTYYQIPLNANLENNTKFKWRCRYQDNKGSWSAWSNETAFNTMNMPTPTPTPTPTSSPTITPTPTPILLAKYTFDNPSDEGWKPFPIPGGTYINDPLGAFYIANTTISTLSAVGILDSDTTYSIYGRWELNTNSPISPCEENYLYRARYWLRTTQTDKNKVPQVRMQWNNYPPQIFALLQVDKGLNAIGTVFAPYDSYYYKSSTDSYGGQNYLIYFDLVDFTPEQSGDVYCDELEVTRQTPLTTGGILVWEQDSNDDFKTWTPVGVSGIFDDVTRGRGNGSIWLESPGPLGAKPLYYGGWSSPYAETSPSFQSDSLYKAIFTLHSESVDAQKHLPMIRLRLSNKTFDWIGMICVRQDVGTYGHMPSHSGTDYYLYMPSPPNLSGIPGDKSDSMVINFDIVDGSENEYGRVYLDHVQVWKYPLQ